MLVLEKENVFLLCLYLHQWRHLVEGEPAAPRHSRVDILEQACLVQELFIQQCGSIVP